MNSEEYLKQSARTVPEDYEAIMQRMCSRKFVDLDHAAKGIFTEGGEFMDALKRFQFYGAELDEVNMKEELGDILWYVALAMRALGTTFDEEMDRNIRKLFKRFPTKFDKTLVLNRNLDAERAELEAGSE